MTHSFKIRTAVLAALAAFALAPAAQAQVVNGSFASGLAGWSTAGDASSQPVALGDPTRLWLSTASLAYEDDFGAGLAAGARNASGTAALALGMPGGLEDFLGLAPGALDPAPQDGVAAYEGPAARQSFAADAGSRLSFRFDFGTLDAGADVAFVLVDGQILTLARSPDATLGAADGLGLHTGWTAFDLVFSSGGLHTLAFGVLDVGDYDATSTLAVTDVRITSPVPEAPASTLLLAGACVLGWRARRQ